MNASLDKLSCCSCFYIILVLFGHSSLFYCCCGFHTTVLAMSALLLALMIGMFVRGITTAVVRRSKPFAAGSLGDTYSLLDCNDLCYDDAKSACACALGRYQFKHAYVSLRDSWAQRFLVRFPEEFEMKFCCSSIRVSGSKLYSAGSPETHGWKYFCSCAAYSLRMHCNTLLEVFFAHGRTFFVLWSFAACIRVGFLYCWLCFYDIVFNVFVLVTCLPPRLFFVVSGVTVK